MTRGQEGLSLIEVLFAITVLSVGLLGAAGVLATGMQNLGSSPADVVATQKAAQAVEAVFAARDSHKLTWAQIRNVQGASGTDGGIFLDAATPLTLPGVDGLVNTTDDDSTTVETNRLPGPDQSFGTGDDRSVPLTNFTRQITIRDVVGEGGQLRSIVVTITYFANGTRRNYQLTTLISVYA